MTKKCTSQKTVPRHQNTSKYTTHSPMQTNLDISGFSSPTKTENDHSLLTAASRNNDGSHK